MPFVIFESNLNSSAFLANSYYQQEKYLFPIIGNSYKKSIKRAIFEEIRIAEAAGRFIVHEGEKYYLIRVSADGAWGKRPSSKSGGHTSITGFVSVIGTKTGLILGAKLKSLYCRTCMPFIKNGRVQKDDSDFPEHECTRNWEGPPGGMEAALTVEILEELLKYKVIVEELVQDGDSSVMALLAEKDIYRKFQVTTRKIDCWLHATRAAGNKLHSIASRSSVLKNSSFGIKAKNCLRSAIGRWNDDYIQNQNSTVAAQGLAADIQNVALHVLGRHESCASWCGKPSSDSIVVDTKVMEDIKIVLGRLVSAARNLVLKMSTNLNELFNNVVAVASGRKFYHYGNSYSCVMR